MDTNEYNNFGYAGVKVELLEALPNIEKDYKKYNFDISAFQWQSIVNSPYLAPLLTESVTDPDGTFAACFPSKRKFINFPNYLTGDPKISQEIETNTNMLLWTPIYVQQGIVKDLINNSEEPYDDYDLLSPQSYIESESPVNEDYLGPLWYPAYTYAKPNPDDEKTIQQFYDWVGGLDQGEEDEEEEEEEATTENAELIPVMDSVMQTVKRSGLWWAIESSNFLTENMPFWVTLHKTQPPTSTSHETFFVISLGINDSENRFDLYLSLDKKPRLIDYYGSLPTENVQKEWEMDTSTIVDEEGKIEVGCMTIGGRLVFFVNGEPLVYNRISHEEGDNGGKLLECKIAPGPIRVYGSNCQTRIHACPMTFAPLSIITLNIPKIVVDNNTKTTRDMNRWYGVNKVGEFVGSVAELPQQSSVVASPLYGVDCRLFSGVGGKCSPSGFGFHRQGKIKFLKADSSQFSGLPSSDFYILSMQPSTQNYAYDGCPYFFRLKGGNDTSAKQKSIKSRDISNLVMSVDENANAPDYFHVKKTMSIELYNENDVADITNKIRAYQTGIRVSWGWNGSYTKTFTGVVTAVTTSEIAGKETLYLQCEDYMHVIDQTPIINSPFYDGMVAYYAIKDLAERAGMTNMVKDWDNEDDYFLPSGYAFSKPAVRFPTQNKILQSMLELLQRFEAYIYFDGDGKLHIAKLPGGLFSADASAVAEFTSDPEGNNVILEERKIDYNFASTVNTISIFTLERDTRNGIVYGKQAKDDHLLFRKPFLYDQAALGSIEVARSYAAELGQRMFYPIRKTSFSTVGSDSLVNPLDFITVDDLMFRVMSVKRSFKAESNDYMNSYECEWLGGQ